MNKARIIALVPLIFTSIQLAGWEAAAAEVRPKVARVVYISASGVCDCAKGICLKGDQVIAQVFVGDRRKLLRIIDLAKDARSADPYVAKLDMAFQVPLVLFVTNKEAAKVYIKKYRLTQAPVLLFLDAGGNLLWQKEGELDEQEIARKLAQLRG